MSLKERICFVLIGVLIGIFVGLGAIRIEANIKKDFYRNPDLVYALGLIQKDEKDVYETEYEKKCYMGMALVMISTMIKERGIKNPPGDYKMLMREYIPSVGALQRFK
ncbi:MAG: hypothetical protein HY764_01705 [Candidatus Portnoybacteria bacterium]|nr:hypothetical protein [Candidatus Portnoybacteria bacterium]